MSDQHLWLKVAESVTPISEDRVQALKRHLNGHVAPVTLNCGAAKPKPKLRTPVNPSAKKPSAPAIPSPLGQFDRRTRQKLTRGNVDIEARVDLHGHTAAHAHSELLRFLVSCREQGKRTVLVITGKGCSPFARHTLHGSDHFHTPERQGRLRRLVPEWLNEYPFRSHVSGFQPAHPRHGGGGAFYVRLRKPGR
ncbi:MAG: Smr/MutS family protein [Pseudomonadota bacterium]